MTAPEATSHTRWVVGLAGLALLLRLGLAVACTPTSLPTNDVLFYHATAALMADGEGFSLYGEPTAHWPPLVPFMYSLVYRVFGPEPLAAVALNSVIGAATVPVLYALVLRTFGTVPARFAAAFLAIMPGQILFADALLAETTYTFMLVSFVCLVAYLPNRVAAALGLGVVAGLATLTRGEGILLPVIALAAWWPELPRRALAGRALLLAAGLALVVVPWTIRNFDVTDGELVPVATNSSTTLWSGHNVDANGGPSYAPPAVLAPAAGKTGIEWEVAEAKVLREEALEHIVEHPLRELKLIPLKLISLNEGDSQAIGTWIHEGVGPAVTYQDLNRYLEARGSTPVGFRRILGEAPPVISTTSTRVIGVAADFAYYVLLAATLLSVFLFRRELFRPRAARGAAAMIAAALFTYGFVYYGNFRYRVPLEPLMMLLASPLAAALVRLRREGRLTLATPPAPRTSAQAP